MEVLDYSIVALYLAGTLFLGFFLHKKASENIQAFFLGGRKIPWWALGASGMASNVDVAGTMIITALVYTLGTKGLFIEIRGGMVLVLAFFMVFLGKWTRRANVMTTAEWMRLRFGDGREGKVAQLVSAVANLVIHVWIISYFAVGGGKFFGNFLGINEQLAAVGMIVFTMLYASASGFYGVVWTDVFQGFIILIGIVYLVALALYKVDLPAQFEVSLPLSKTEFQSLSISLSDWSSLKIPWSLDLPGQYSTYNLFSITIGFYLLKTCIEGLGGAGGYMSQRFFAASSDREAGLLSLFWIFLLSFRWPLVTAIAMLAIHYSQTQAPILDPELALPIVLNEYAPTGMKGLLVACFMAAAMSTFVAIINASAAYWVKDIYQSYLKPEASQKDLVWQSRLASIVIVVLGLLFSLPVVNINDIWGWITMAFGTGLFLPLMLRWYWWRYNGWGFTLGTVFGMTAAVASRFWALEVPDYMNFVIPASASLFGILLGTFLTPATNAKTLENFYKNTKPFGVWGPISKNLSDQEQKDIRLENRWDLISLALAIPWMITLAMFGMQIVMGQIQNIILLAIVLLALSVGLYFSWYRRLSKS